MCDGAWSSSYINHGAIGARLMWRLLTFREQAPGIAGPQGLVLADAIALADELRPLLDETAGVPVTVAEARFFSTPHPFRIHAETGRDEEVDPCKTFLIPLSEKTATVTFGQYWWDLRASFVKGSPELGTPGYDTVTDYTELIGLSDEPFPDDFREQHLGHLAPEMLQGLSPEFFIPWRIGDVIVFDSARLHCSADFVFGRQDGLVLHTVKAAARP